MARELGAEDAILPRWENSNSGGREGLLEAYLGLLSHAQIRGLLNIYRDDFLMFGYGFSFRGISFNV